MGTRLVLCLLGGMAAQLGLVEGVASASKPMPKRLFAYDGTDCIEVTGVMRSWIEGAERVPDQSADDIGIFAVRRDADSVLFVFGGVQECRAFVKERSPEVPRQAFPSGAKLLELIDQYFADDPKCGAIWRAQAGKSRLLFAAQTEKLFAATKAEIRAEILRRGSVVAQGVAVHGDLGRAIHEHPDDFMAGRIWGFLFEFRYGERIYEARSLETEGSRPR